MRIIAALGIPCEDLPMILMGFGSFLAVYVIMKWARQEEPELLEYHWGDPHRRPKRDDVGIVSHMIGALLAAFAIAFALNHPICGP